MPRTLRPRADANTSPYLRKRALTPVLTATGPSTMSSRLHFHFAEHLPMTQRALGFARSRHGDQHRDGDGAVFVVHPAEVASLLARLGYSDDVVAAVLHDVLEDRS